MSRPRTIQELIHWLEVGAGARWVRLAAVVAVTTVLSLRVAWVQFHGPATENVLLQADTGRQLASGAGFTTLVTFPQTVAFFQKQGIRFDPKRPYPEVHQAPFYSMVIAGALRVLPEKMRERLFEKAPVAPDGFAADYFLLGLNLLLFWLAAGMTYALARRLFDARTGWVAAIALLVSVAAWQQVVAVNGTTLLMVLALAEFWILAKIEGEEGAEVRFPARWLVALGVVGGLLFLTEYSAAALTVVALGFVALRFAGRARALAVLCVVVGFSAVGGPWIARNLALTGLPVGLAVQNVALKFGDSTAEPANQRATLAAALPEIDLNKLGNKVLTTLQENLKTRIWSGGGMWLTAFFVAGWLYAFRSPSTNRLRWTFTAAFGVMLMSQAVFNSGESERLVPYWLSPLIMIFGAGFFFVLLESNARLGTWPRLCATGLLVAQALPLAHDAIEPRRLHFNYPPYFPGLFMGMRQELERRDARQQFGLMADVPAGVAWYGHQRVWAQPVHMRDFYAVTLEQPIGELLLTPRTLDRPFFTELASRPAPPGAMQQVNRFGDWGLVYGGLFNGQFPREFPLNVPQRLAENLYVMLNPALPPVRGK
ncbi:MAG: hypothetical protein JWM32_2785 [Verrucomicrobia bacterium]|nr:hypothetical protein [Verrucomicrobiota bacterium]